VADEMISKEFLEGFKKYVLENHAVDLFHQNKFDFKTSKETILLQLADLIGGTINRFYAGKSKVNVRDILPMKFIGELNWPEKYKSYTVDETEINDPFKDVISDLALLRIENYLNRNFLSSDLITRKRVYFLNYLRAIFLYNSKTRFIYTDEILRHLEQLTGERLKEQYFRQQIVGPLRTEGLLISSNINGYKIPSSKADIHAFFNLSSKIIHPMLQRLKMTQEALKQATGGELEILDAPEYAYLKKLIE